MSPFFTVVVPTRNRPASLAACLEALARQTFEDFEVVVVDDGSRPAAEVAPGVVAGRGIRCLRLSGAGPAAARNAGADAAAGAYLAFLDDDCLPEVDWLAQLAEACRRWPEALVGGDFATRGSGTSVISQRTISSTSRYEEYTRGASSPRAPLDNCQVKTVTLRA